MRKIQKRIFLSLLIFVSLFSFITVGYNALPVRASNSVYTQKVIAVVYDNSGSMSSSGKNAYAKYAMQGLMSVVGSNDLMYVFPLNHKNNCDISSNPRREYVPEQIEVDLSNPDRNQVVKDIIDYEDKSDAERKQKDPFYPGNQTPPGALGTAVKWLEGEGLNDYESVDGKEFWLVILSDGQFMEGIKTYNTSKVVEENISGYVGLQTIYFGMCADENMKIDELVQKNSSVTAYYTSTADEIIEYMQTITNRITGRYTLQTGVSQDGNQVTIDLSDCDFSISSLAILAQATDDSGQAGESLTLKTVSSPTIELSSTLASSISVKEKVSISGYSSVIVPTDQKDYINQDVITLTFNVPPSTLSVLVEPAIVLDSGLQYYDEGSREWKDTTVETINTSFKEGATVRPVYRLLDGKTSADLTDKLSSNVKTVVSYNGQTYDYGEGFNLKLGKKEVALSVNINIGGSDYTLYNSWLCDIDVNPTAFRIEPEITEGYNGDRERIKVEYKVFNENVQLKKEAFEGKSPDFTWDLVELKDPQGNDVVPEKSYVSDDGLITLIYKVKFGQFGSYKSKIKVVCTDNKRSRYGEAELSFYPSALKLQTTSSDELTLTTNQFKDNDNGFEFKLTSDGQPIGFDCGVLEYTLKVGGEDQTRFAKIEGNVLRFTPTDASVPKTMQGLGSKNVELKVWSKKDASVSASSTVKLSIVKSTYLISVVEENTEIDIYDLNNCDGKIYYKINLDGKDLTAKQLQEGLNNKTITVDYNKFGWVLLLPANVDVSVVEMNGTAYICCALGSTWWKPLSSLFASFIFTGDKVLTLSVGGVSANGSFYLSPVSFLSRLWRWIVIIIAIYIIVHIVLWIIGFFVVKSVSKGCVVAAEIAGNNPRSEIVFSVHYVNLDPKLTIYWHLKRLIPFKEFMNQPKIVLRGLGIEFFVDPTSKAERIKLVQGLKTNTLIGDDDDEMYTEFVNFRKSCSTYKFKKKGRRPSLNSPIKTRVFKEWLNEEEGEETNGKPMGIQGDKYYVSLDLRGRPENVIFFIRST